MRGSSHVIGSKRKRVASTNENTHTNGRPTRTTGRIKRLKINDESPRNYRRMPTSDESQTDSSEMDVDAASIQEVDTESDVAESEQVIEDEDYDPSDDFLSHSAPPKTLNRLLKHRLIELYELCGLTGDPESLTKADIIDAIVNNRDDIVSVPPSSPPGKGDVSSEYSSDDGHVAGGEETDAVTHRSRLSNNPLRRRVTVHDIGQASLRPLKNRSLSLGNLLGNGQPSTKLSLSKQKASMQVGHSLVPEATNIRRRVSTRSSPSTSNPPSNIISSPPATRLRSRNTSTSIPTAVASHSSSTRSKAKGKAKQVEFSDAVDVHEQPHIERSSKGKEVERQLLGSGSDLTELEDSEEDRLLGQPSPRRLRSKDREVKKSKEKAALNTTPVASQKQRKKGKNIPQNHLNDPSEVTSTRKLRLVPMRKAKKGIGSLKESDNEVEEEEEEDELVEEREETEEASELAVEEDEDTEEESEVDELVSSASLSPPPEPQVRQTPLRKRLRPGRTRKVAPTADEENEGDDENEEGGDHNAEEEAEDDDDEATIAVEPRKLRNGKIVGEEDVEMEVDEQSVDGEEDEDGEIDEEDGEGEGEEDEEGGDDAQSIDIAEETDEDENMEDDVDLTVATAKTLVRLRRDDLVRLCETRDLDPTGTKPQLAEALLQWRDRQENDFSSPSSGGTVRPSSTRRTRRTKHHSSSTNTTTPVLLRSEHEHTDEPRTPVPGKEKEKEEDLELDLESLGLEDREIPPEKLTKLEKIGSGGFKDVFIGKFKNRKIAIAEFRGQLSAMDIKELKLLGAFNHPNIVRFLGVSIPENTKETPVMIISELCSNGDLFDYIRNTNPPTLRKVLQIMLDIARGLEYLHTRKPSIIHRDCKSSNILITAKGTAKIADFGLAKVKQSTRSMVRSLVGTVNWQAPELWSAHPKYNHKVDVFSCAMVFWEMLQWHATTKKFPWEGMNEHAIYEIVGAKRQRPPVASLRKQWCSEIVDLVEHMWAQEHQDRPTMTEVVEALEDLLSKY